ncbi:hypothetical protein [Aureivirga sp. CE67]|uniref:hypothetical protein n=1 Tax=Aureivirga sp. CE67 TaxID=1788983 RepID=UPI0018C968EA|nr:hypothetical protein [Aureivirga sp. CE67]
MEIIECFEEFKESLQKYCRSNARIRIKDKYSQLSERKLKTNSNELKNLEEYLGYKLPQDFLSYQKISTSIYFQWRGNFDQNDIWYCISGNQEVESMYGILQNHRAIIKKYTGTKLLQYLKNGYIIFSTLGTGFRVLAKIYNDTHELYLYIPDEESLHKLTVNAEEFAELSIRTRGLELWPLYITEEFPECMKKYPYTGFFEQMEMLFPEEDLSRFRHRELFADQPELNVRFHKWNYKGRLEKAFLNLPENCKVIQCLPGQDIPVNNAEYGNVLSWQLGLGKVFPEDFTAYRLCSLFTYMEWQEDNDVRANFKIHRIEDIFSQNAAEHYGLEKGLYPHLEDKYILYCDPYHDIVLHFEDDGLMPLFIIPTDSNPNWECYHYTDSFDQFMDDLLNARGMFHWPKYLITKHSLDDPDYVEFKEKLLRLFPNADISRYERKTLIVE